MKSVSLTILFISLLFVLPGCGARVDLKPLWEPPQAANVSGKYFDLLATMKAPTDRYKNGDLKEFGYQNIENYLGYSQLPDGYWVYVYPDYYIWGESNLSPRAPKQVGPVKRPIIARRGTNIETAGKRTYSSQRVRPTQSVAYDDGQVSSNPRGKNDFERSESRGMFVGEPSETLPDDWQKF